MSENNVTHKDLSALLGVSETTIKSYRRKFPGCIPVANQGKPIRFTPEAVRVVTRIRDLFDIGMSVAEVRSRLIKEFSWISPDNPERPGNVKTAEASAKTAPLAVTPELSVGVSNMAKSMVAMTQQQKAILARMQGIEALLEELGLKGPLDADGIRRKNAEEAKQREEKLEQRLDRLDEAAQELAGTVHGLAEELGRFLGQRADAAAVWKRESTEVLAEAARLCGKTSDPAQGDVPQSRSESASFERGPDPSHASAQESAAQENIDNGASAAAGAHIYRLRPPQRPEQGEEPSGSEALEPRQKTFFSTQTPRDLPPSSPSEPPRHFFSLPLVVRTEQDRYISAGGRGRGRFSINDFKAMLIHSFMPPNHFTLRWEPHGQGWRLFLEQQQTRRAMELVLMELPTQSGNNVVEILHLKNSGALLHPAEINSIIISLSSGDW